MRVAHVHFWTLYLTYYVYYFFAYENIHKHHPANTVNYSVFDIFDPNMLFARPDFTTTFNVVARLGIKIPAVFGVRDLHI